jgi:hypothetical protein
MLLVAETSFATALKTFTDEKDEPFLSRCHGEPGKSEAIFDNASNGTAQTRG